MTIGAGEPSNSIRSPQNRIPRQPASESCRRFVTYAYRSSQGPRTNPSYRRIFATRSDIFLRIISEHIHSSRTLLIMPGLVSDISRRTKGKNPLHDGHQERNIAKKYTAPKPSSPPPTVLPVPHRDPSFPVISGQAGHPYSRSQLPQRLTDRQTAHKSGRGE